MLEIGITNLVDTKGATQLGTFVAGIEVHRQSVLHIKTPHTAISGTAVKFSRVLPLTGSDILKHIHNGYLIIKQYCFYFVLASWFVDDHAKYTVVDRTVKTKTPMRIELSRYGK